MTLKLSPKQARKMGLVEKEEKKPARLRPHATLNSYAGCCEAQWAFTTLGERGDQVYAWRIEKGTTLRTSVLPAGAGDNLGAHYRAAIDAIVRGEWEVSP